MAVFQALSSVVGKKLDDRELKKRMTADYGAFLPERAGYDAAMQAQVEEILGQLPVSEEAFEAELARRGIYGAGEGPKHMYRNVYAPIARSALTTMRQSQLDYLKAYQYGTISGEQLKFNYTQLWIQKQIEMEKIKAMRDAANKQLWGQIAQGLGMAAGAIL